MRKQWRKLQLLKFGEFLLPLMMTPSRTPSRKVFRLGLS
jgi:hypothetical protein